MILFPSNNVPPSTADLDATRHHSVYQLAMSVEGKRVMVVEGGGCESGENGRWDRDAAGVDELKKCAG